MNRWMSAAVVMWLVPAALVGAQDDDAVAAERDPAHAKWAWFVEATPSARDGAPAPWHALEVPPSVFGKAQPDLRDLRLVDAAGVRVPYVLRVLSRKAELTPVPIVREFDAAPSEKNRFFQVSLELGDVGSGHNEIEIHMPGKNYRRHVQVFGDKTAKFDDPRPILGKDKYLVDYETDAGPVRVRRHDYSLTQFHFLQVRVDADPGDKEIQRISKVIVRRKIVSPGSYTAQPANLQPRQDVRTDEGPGSAWYIDFGEPRPVERLRFKAAGEPVERPYRIQVANPNQPRQDLFGSEWRWRRDKEQQNLEIVLPQEASGQRFRFVVTDFANPPLELQGVEAIAAVRQVLFQLPKDRFAAPLRLYFGNPDAGPARYDLEKAVPAILEPPPVLAHVGERQANPNYVPPVRPLHERHRWLIYLVLGIASVVLLGLLGLLARNAMAAQEVAAKTKTDEESKPT